ncbi:MAG: lamin tail domain-containing protein [Kofleriaceae bacterium]|nr:MAG: lamin tail domain-containing protein [Kofleriaceae bacterium]MBZ0236073.1 hypothetical protein [Kofleriaceae bacterium]
MKHAFVVCLSVAAAACGKDCDKDTIVDRSAPPAMIVNELLFDPGPSDRGQEWIELRAGAAAIRLDGWTVVTSRATVALPAIELPAGAFLVVRSGDGADDLDASDGAATLHARLAGEMLGDDGESVALYACRPSARCIVDYVAYAFQDAPVAGPAEAHAVAAGIWTGGAVFDDGLSTEGGDSLGRDAASLDRDVPGDWAGLGGIEATGATPGAPNFGELAYGLQPARDPCNDRPIRGTDAQNQHILDALRQLREQHPDLFDGLDAGMGDGAPTVGPDGEIRVGRVRIRWGRNLNPGGRRALGRACPPATPDGDAVILLDIEGLDELWKVKESLLHELVHVGQFRLLDGGYWRRIGERVVDSGIRDLVNPIHECFCYVANLRLLERLLAEFPDHADAIRTRMSAKVNILDQQLRDALDSLGRLGDPMWNPIRERFRRLREEIFRWKLWEARRVGGISDRERRTLERIGRALGLTGDEMARLLETSCAAPRTMTCTNDCPGGACCDDPYAPNGVAPCRELCTPGSRWCPR